MRKVFQIYLLSCLHLNISKANLCLIPFTVREFCERKRKIRLININIYEKNQSYNNRLVYI